MVVRADACSHVYDSVCVYHVTFDVIFAWSDSNNCSYKNVKTMVTINLLISPTAGALSKLDFENRFVEVFEKTRPIIKLL